MKKLVAIAALAVVSACGHRNEAPPPPPVPIAQEPAPQPPAPPPVRVDGTVIPQEVINEFAASLSVAADSDEAVNSAAYFIMLKKAAEREGVEVSPLSDEAPEAMAQLEPFVFDALNLRPPGDQPYLRVDIATFVMADMDAKPLAERKKQIRAYYKACQKKPGVSIFQQFQAMKLDRMSDRSVLGNQTYAQTRLAWVPETLPVGALSPLHETADTFEFVRLLERIDPKYPDRHTWMVTVLMEDAKIER